jgi:ABC-type Fe3+ transport system permease subunit
MQKRITFIITTLVLALGLLAFPLSVYAASAASNTIKQGADSENVNGPSVDSTISFAINTLSWVVGIASVIMIIYGGFKYVTSAGDANKASSAKNTIIYALIGVVVAGMAQVILRVVINRTK